MVERPSADRDEKQAPDWSVYLVRGNGLTLVWADAGYLRLVDESHVNKGVVGLPIADVSPLAATHAQALQTVLATGEQQQGVDRLTSVEDGTTEIEWRAYSPLPDHVLVVMYRKRPAAAKLIAEQLERLARARAESALLIESQRQAAAALRDYQERAAALLLQSQEDAAETVRVLQLADVEKAPPGVRDALLRKFDEAAEELQRLQDQAAQALRESQSAVAAMLAEETKKETDAWQTRSEES